MEPLDPASASRRAIAERMLASSRNTAAVTLTTTADATELVHLAKDFARREGAAAPGLTDFLVAATAAALLEHRGMNAHWIDGRHVPAGEVNIGLAVDTPRALLVPVIHRAASLEIHDLSARCRELVERARDGNLGAAEMRGGTFTITNLGMLDIDTFTPIIREPEIGILGIGRLRRQPLVHDGEIIARDVISLSLTFDHRAIDGAPAARFLRAVRRFIEDPGPRFQE